MRNDGKQAKWRCNSDPQLSKHQVALFDVTNNGAVEQWSNHKQDVYGGTKCIWWQQMYLVAADISGGGKINLAPGTHPDSTAAIC